jgi:ABC-type antimicrobial peptide transport system permease subunit
MGTVGPAAARRTGAIHLRDVARQAGAALAANKLRAGLTALGIAAAVFGLLSITSAIRLADTFVRERVSWLFGAHRASLVRASKFDTASDRREWYRRPPLTLDDLAAVRRACASCRLVAGQAYARPEASRGGRVADALARGVDASMLQLLPEIKVAAGRPFLEGELAEGAAVALVGADVAAALFPGRNAVDQMVLLAGLPFRIVGVLQRVGMAFGESHDGVVFVPLPRLLSAFQADLRIELEARSRDQVDAAVDEAREALRRRGRRTTSPPDFEFVRNQELGNYEAVLAASYAAGSLVSGLGLLIAAVVGSNVFLVAVADRTLEIGIHRAVGARRKDVARVFMAEALLVSWVGAVAALLLLRGLAVLLAPLLVGLLSPGADTAGSGALAQGMVDARTVAVALAFATLVGIGAGVMPARRAAGLDPVEAMRQEA